MQAMLPRSGLQMVSCRPKGCSLGSDIAEITKSEACFCTVQGSCPVREGDAMRGILAAVVGLTLGLYAQPCHADDGSSLPSSTTDAPLVTLGRPVPVEAASNRAPAASAIVDVQLRPATYLPPAPANTVTSSASPNLSGPPPSLSPGAPLSPASPAEKYNCGVVTRSPVTD